MKMSKQNLSRAAAPDKEFLLEFADIQRQEGQAVQFSQKNYERRTVSSHQLLPH